MTEPQAATAVAESAASRLVANFERLWSTKDAEIVREIVAPNAVAFWSGLGTFSGADYPARMQATMHRVTPDIRVQVTGHAIQDDLVFISWRATATIGDQEHEWEGIDRFRLEGDLAVEVHAIYDAGELRAVAMAGQP